MILRTIIDDKYFVMALLTCSLIYSHRFLEFISYEGFVVHFIVAEVLH